MSSPLNKTLIVTKKDEKLFPLLKFNPKQNPDLQNKLFYGNCLIEMKKLPSECVDLVVADPPYTIKRNFGAGTIATNNDSFTTWCEKWIGECCRLLKPTSSIYICINWEASSIIESILKKYFIVRNRITWKRDKGRGAKKNWKNNLEDIWFATKSADYTFNLNAVKIKRPVLAPYIDKTGKPRDWQEKNGKKFRYTHPSNIWTDLVVPFWSMAENTEHPTQKPEKLIERIILASSNKDDLVFDPFIGSGTTAVVARKLGRNFLGFEIEKKFYVLAKKRLNTVNQLIPMI